MGTGCPPWNKWALGQELKVLVRVLEYNCCLAQREGARPLQVWILVPLGNCDTVMGSQRNLFS